MVTANCSIEWFHYDQTLLCLLRLIHANRILRLLSVIRLLGFKKTITIYLAFSIVYCCKYMPIRIIHTGAAIL